MRSTRWFLSGGLALAGLLGTGFPLLAHEKSAVDATSQQTIDRAQVPPAALHVLESEAAGHPIKAFIERTFPDGTKSYEVRFKSTTEGLTEVEVAPEGYILGHFNRLDQPIGTGP